MSSPPLPTVHYERTAVLDLIHSSTKDIHEWYSPSLDVTFNFHGGPKADQLAAWRGREMLDYRAEPPVYDDGSDKDDCKILSPGRIVQTKRSRRRQQDLLYERNKEQEPRNIHDGPILTAEQERALVDLVEREEQLKQARTAATALFENVKK